MSGIGRLFGWTLLLAAVTAGASVAQDLGGDWDMQVCVQSLGGPPADPAGEEECICEYEGSVTIMTNGGFSGPTALSNTLGDDELCPTMLTGTIDGDQMNGSIAGTISGDLGALGFEGSVMEAMASQSAPQQQLQANGAFVVEQGRFVDGFGTFAAQQAPVVPALGTRGLLLLALLLFATGGYYLSRRRGLTTSRGY